MTWCEPEEHGSVYAVEVWDDGRDGEEEEEHCTWYEICSRWHGSGNSR